MKDANTISLEAAQGHPVDFDFELTFPLEALDREPLVEISPVHFAGQVTSIEAGFALQADLGWGGMLECSRCLVAYPFRSDEEFSLVLYPRQAAGEEERELEREELDVYFFEERIQMAVPMKPLCREDCRGLCVRCGQDLNAATCPCSEKTIDPRWEALQKLKKV